MFGLQPCLPVLGLGSVTQLSSRASLEQQRRPQGALARLAPLERRIAAVQLGCMVYAVLGQNHEFAIAVCEDGESLV